MEEIESANTNAYFFLQGARVKIRNVRLNFQRNYRGSVIRTHRRTMFTAVLGISRLKATPRPRFGNYGVRDEADMKLNP